ncbi:hypothetical protein WJX84_001002 [Apatococcus fuscideae]|uniref:Uncharacterized protein n=1 Tax=Apatococcus fuscideae TaxID=2026836 RepID=A0AAW1TFW1_9CHLO
MTSSRSSAPFSPLDLEQQQPALSTWCQRLVSKLSPGKSSNGFTRLHQQTEEDLNAGEDAGEDGLQKARWCPEEEAGWVSWLYLGFITTLVEKGYRKPLRQEDLWALPRTEATALQCPFFDEALESTVDPVTAPQGSIRSALIKVHWRRFSIVALLEVGCSFGLLLNPFVLQQLLLELEHGARTGVAVGLAFALAVNSLVESLFDNHYWFAVRRLELRAKAQLIDSIYRKSLRITSATKGSMGVGAIVNLQSNDGAKIWEMIPYLNFIWASPLQILVIMALLVRIVTPWPALAGFVVTCTMVPVSAWIFSKIGGIRANIMACSDARVKAISEALTGIKAIKLYAWEGPWSERISGLREQELLQIKRAALLSITGSLLWIAGPIVVSLTSLATYTLLGHTLTAAVAFPALALFDILSMPVNHIPEIINQLAAASVAFGRISAFLAEPELDGRPAAVPERQSEGPSISISRGTFSWEAGEEPVLRSLEAEILQGQLVMVTGPVGSGKTSLLAAMLGELIGHQAQVSMSGTIAYTAQDPWVCHATLRDNILMGQAMDGDRYHNVLEACALLADLPLLPAGDLSEIGEKGINLSGGQKHRVALARACYAAADINLLDDPLSAVDAHVGQHIFERAICSFLGSSTRVLVTHQQQFLPAADIIFIVSEGQITHRGSYHELEAKGVEFKQFELHKDEPEGKSDPNEHHGGTPLPDMDVSASQDLLSESHLAGRSNSIGDGTHLAELPPDPSEDGKIIEEEERATGRVDISIYHAYFAHWSRHFWLPILAVCICASARLDAVAQNWWLSSWAETGSVTTEPPAPSSHYLLVYAMFGAAAVILWILQEYTLIMGGLNASRKLHSRLLERVMRLPMSFFDSQPSGRLLNRFTKDTEAVDTQILPMVGEVLICGAMVMGSVLTVIIIAPWMALLFIPLIPAYEHVRRRFVMTAREVKRLDSLAASPIFSNFGETLQGLMTVRAFRQEQQFVDRNRKLIDESNRCLICEPALNRWVSLRLQAISILFIFATAIFVVLLLRDSPGLAGLAMTSALGTTGVTQWLVRQATRLEVQMNSVERIIEYTTRHEPEAPATIEGHRPPQDWPQEGQIDFQGLVVRYRPGLPPVLKDLTFCIRPKEKVGVAGRTGCGKSTLMMALYRLVEPSGGQIIIDGINTGSIGLQDLRSRLALVPQDPVIFSGSIRDNLDPFGRAGGDGPIWQALEQASVASAVRDLQGGLDAEVTEGGGNLSAGQRQLLCMARALLRKPRILVLDEATSNVDNDTDEIVQATVRRAFKECTVMTIAHRLHTIIDADRILLLDAGQVKEFDSPNTLLKDSASAFYQLVHRTTGDQKSR